jgi:hypothetical protein
MTDCLGFAREVFRQRFNKYGRPLLGARIAFHIVHSPERLVVFMFLTCCMTWSRL